ncbi:sensor histidine kinase [Puia dinghuensis]|uniref:sensor histidine kinase n=1 Tax=Puia dinghuensis TaxID=1792502 RepID=UPI001666A04B|nr:HAMP domain-containing sensor histidine kinase [Puia dinghuensis]
MIRSLLNWRSFLALAGIVIVTATIFYSQYLAKKIAADERQKVDLWVAASKSVLNNPGMDLTLPNLIRNGQQSIPIIETNEQDSIIDYINLDSFRVARDRGWLYKQLEKFRAENKRIEIKLNDTPYIANRYYYGHTALLDEVRYYPLVQLFIVTLFIFFTLYSITIRNKATQNQLWAGMAKETAHQLGTPVSSLEGWVEMLKESAVDGRTVAEIQKDVDRLKLVSDRFGKIGSKPVLEEKDLIGQVQNMMEYIRKRATGKVQFALQTQAQSPLYVRISGPLFDWVIENLLKNALDAIEGKGTITIGIVDHLKEIVIDVTDTGKGIAARNLQKVFKPGFTTKKRGWGLGLSLSKRIIEQYHKGQLFVRQSELGKGTTFRIVLKK